MDREKTVKLIEENKIISVLRGVDKDRIIPLVKALYKGGIRIVEVAFIQGENNVKTCEIIQTLKKEFGDGLCIGGGTVLDQEQVELTKKSGGDFIVSPDAYGEVINKTLELDMVSVAGAFTPSEIHNANKLKADFIKLFPASALGADYIKAIKAPFPKIKILAFGGIGVKDIKSYVTAGAVGFGISSTIIDRKKLAKNDYNAITKLAEKYVKAVK